MQLSGQTPIFRAKNLEKYIGVKGIYLKLEGSNPTGHKNDRIAESLIKFALDQDNHHILVYGSNAYVQSISYFSNGMSVQLYSPKDRSNIKQQDLHKDISWISIKKDKQLSVYETYERYAKENDMFFMCEYEKKPVIRNLAIQKITEEILTRLKETTHIWTQLKSGNTFYSIYNEALRQWIKDDIEFLPKITCGTNHEVLEIIDVDDSFKEIMHTSRTDLLMIDNIELKKASSLIKRLENIVISPKESYALAAFLKKEHKEDGTHVIILNDGKSSFDIHEVSKTLHLDVERLVSTTRSLLDPYHDSIAETKDAIEMAIKGGYIFKAEQEGEIQGLCIVVPMGFDEFIPSFHLAYIGVLKNTKGRGVATELMNQAIEKTNGNLSLHVDIENKRAKKLYEKMGFVHKYERMIYKG